MIFDQIALYKKIADYEFEKIKNDDFVDKLSRKFSFAMMIIFASTLGISGLVGNPISCWCLAEHNGGRCDYATKYCYITSLYVPVGNESSLPKREELQEHKILYYQWVPYIFLFQAFLFYLPSILWTFISKRTDYDIDSHVAALNSDKINQTVAVTYVVSYFDKVIKTRENAYKKSRGLPKRLLFSFLQPSGVYLTICHFFIKLIYAAVALGQIFLMNYWFRDNYHASRQSKLNFLFGSFNWRLSERFPRMTLCKFQVYILNEQQPHWIQCALPSNIYIEKMYIIIAVWSFILFIITLLKAAETLFSVCSSKTFISRYVDKLSEQEISEIGKSSQNLRLRPDDMLALKLIHTNTNKNAVSSIIKELSNRFY